MKARLSFQGWILGGCLVVVVCTLVFVAVVMERSLSSHMLNLVRSSMQREILTVREVVRDRWQPGRGIAAGDKLADELGRIVGARVTLVTPQGKVLGDSQMARNQVPEMVNHADRPEIIQAMKQGEGSAVRYSSTLGTDLMYTALRLDGPDGQTLLVRLALPLSQVQQALGRTRGLVLWAVFLGVLLSIGVAYLVARSLSRPVQQLTRTAASIAAGDLSRRFTRYPRHEIGELGRAFDQMADNLQSTINDITQSRDRLEAILRGMVEGVLVIDNDGQVLLANRALMEMLELKAVPPRTPALGDHPQRRPVGGPGRGPGGAGIRVARDPDPGQHPPLFGGPCGAHQAARPRGRAWSACCTTSPSASAWKRPGATWWPTFPTSCAPRSPRCAARPRPSWTAPWTAPNTPATSRS